jgi:hypothetical protein
MGRILMRALAIEKSVPIGRARRGSASIIKPRAT